MKSRKNGFTLVEILAVLAILSIVLLMVIPGVIKIIEQSNKSMFVNNARTLLRAGKLYYTEKDMIGEETEAVTFEFPNDIKNLDVGGILPEDGVMIIDEQGEIALAVSNGKYCITKYYTDKDIKIEENARVCAIPYTLAAVATTSESLGITEIDECSNKGIKCTFAEAEPTEFAIQVNDTDIYKFYVIDDTGEEVTMIMDRNLVPKVAWGTASSGPVKALEALKTATSSWENILEREYIVSDEDGAKDYEDFTVVMKARMLLYSETSKLGCKFNTTNTCPAYLYENLSSSNTAKQPLGYWVPSIASNGQSLYVLWDARTLFYHPHDARYYGVRPVITLTKI